MNKKAFTLIEILVAISIFSVVTLIIGNLYVLSQKTYLKTNNKNELIQNARVCLDRMSREIRQAAALATPLSSSTPTNYIEFQDGHDLSQITYIKYEIIGTNLVRSHLAYYFAGYPNDYIYFDSLGSPLVKNLDVAPILIGEYFSNLEITGENGLITLITDLSKQNENISVQTKTYIRNW